MTPKQQTFFVVGYDEMLRYIATCWGAATQRVECEEMANDSVYKASRVAKGYPYLDQDDLASYKERGSFPVYDLRSVLCDLCDHDQLPPGDYLMEVCW